MELASGRGLDLAKIISLVSHELRTPIAHIMGFSSSLLQPDIEWDDETIRDFVGEIHRESQHLAGLVTDLLAMSKIECGQDLLKKDWNDPAALLERTLASLEEYTANHVVRLRVDEEIPTIHVNAPKIKRVLYNLIENAAKYSPPGTLIQVTADRNGDEVIFCVADQGPGIAAEHQTAIFEPFFRIDPRRSGAGLGLTLCKAFVEQHGGRMWVETEPRLGSRFWFSLPIRYPDTPSIRVE